MRQAAPGLVFFFHVFRVSRNRTWHGYWNSRSSRDGRLFKARNVPCCVSTLSFFLSIRLKRLLKRSRDWESRSEDRKKERPFCARYSTYSFRRSLRGRLVTYLRPDKLLDRSTGPRKSCLASRPSTMVDVENKFLQAAEIQRSGSE